jgi:hypothetical protein
VNILLAVEVAIWVILVVAVIIRLKRNNPTYWITVAEPRNFMEGYNIVTHDNQLLEVVRVDQPNHRLKVRRKHNKGER